MKSLFVMAAGALLLSGIASAAELPAYELLGFPISLHQLSVTGTTANVKDQSASTSLLFAGMPASPHQVSVLAQRPRMIEKLAAATHPLGQASFSIR